MKSLQAKKVFKRWVFSKKVGNLIGFEHIRLYSLLGVGGGGGGGNNNMKHQATFKNTVIPVDF